MKFFGGSSKSHHAANSRQASHKPAVRASSALRWLRTLLIVLLAVVLMVTAITMAIKSISKPPERPNIQDEATMSEPDLPSSDKQEDPPEDESGSPAEKIYRSLK